MNKAVFLDRDGTVLKDKGYMYKPEDIEFLPDAIKGLKNIKKKGYKLIIITNQSGIGRGYFKEENYFSFRDNVNIRLKEQGVIIDKEYYCKHDPKESCNCRKPNTEHIEKAIIENNIKISSSFFIGDKTTDIETGKRAGCRTILVKTGEAGTDNKYKTTPDFICENLYEASLII